MKKNTLILDLDDTIFQTNTIDKKVVAPFFEHLITVLRALYTAPIIENIVTDLWKDSWDVVIERYQIPNEIFLRAVQALERRLLKLEIATYTDYHFIKKNAADKFLVTTGLTSFQKAKIKALNIENDFKKIIINDKFIESKSKLDIFRALIEEHQLVPENTYVIGDNPHSEIQAGNVLNLNTIQILRDNNTKGNNANYYIHSFEELSCIINR
jgi:FMN phosphatase YigB (HAD superfamily)